MKDYRESNYNRVEYLTWRKEDFKNLYDTICLHQKHMMSLSQVLETFGQDSCKKLAKKEEKAKQSLQEEIAELKSYYSEKITRIDDCLDIIRCLGSESQKKLGDIFREEQLRYAWEKEARVHRELVTYSKEYLFAAKKLYRARFAYYIVTHPHPSEWASVAYESLSKRGKAFINGLKHSGDASLVVLPFLGMMQG